MPTIDLATNETQRSYGKLPRLQLRNIFPEPDSSNGVTGVTYFQRPGLSPFLTLGIDAILAVWHQLGTFAGDYLVSTGGVLFRVSEKAVATNLGSIPNTRAQIAASATRAVLAPGGVAYSTDGTTLTTVTIPDGLPISGVAFISGFFVLTVAGTQKFFWIAPGETDPDDLSFAEAERSPDAIVSPAVVGDELWFLGQSGEEVWSLTGDLDAPMQRINGRVYENGCANRDTVVEVDTQLLWVTADYRVVLAAGAPTTVSTPAITEHLRLSDPASLRAWVFKLDTHVFYVLTSDRDTFALDLSTKTWMRFSTLDQETWQAHLGSGSLCGDSVSGTLWKIDPAADDDAGIQMDRRISGGVQNTGVPARCNNVSVGMVAGWSPSPSFEPVIEMRHSSDAGNTWTGWQSRGLGVQGQYGKQVIWNKQGIIAPPGRIWEWRMADKARYRLSFAQYNESWG